MKKEKILDFYKSASDTILARYQIKYFPVGIKFLKEREDTFGFLRTKQRKSICAFLKIAARGESFYVDEDAISCPGGLRWMGFSSKLTETYFYKYFLGEVEKIKESPDIAEKFLNFLPQPPKEGTYQKIIFGPIKNFHFHPDVIVLISVPRFAYQIITDAYLDEYHLLKIIPICAACHGVISIPFTTGELNFSFIDSMSRKLGSYKNDEVLIGIPCARFLSLMENIKKLPKKNIKQAVIAKIIKKMID